MDLKTILFANAYAQHALYVYEREKFGYDNPLTKRSSAVSRKLYDLIEVAGLHEEYLATAKAWESIPWPEWREKYGKLVLPDE